MTSQKQIELCEYCKTEMSGNFCSNCGRARTLKRINSKYILSSKPKTVPASKLITNPPIFLEFSDKITSPFTKFLSTTLAFHSLKISLDIGDLPSIYSINSFISGIQLLW